ncbi:Flagellar biosynthesis protein FliC [Candidatus Paraburkholderia kirkii]|nr:Flagellar biosynthesis protein FliC [Candidatus Paraburkholderia kirkii]
MVSAPSTITAKAGGALSPSKQFAALSTAHAANTPSAPAQEGTVIGTVSNLNIDAATGKDATSSTTSFIISVTAKADGSGGVEFFDQDGKSLGDGTGSSVASKFLTVTAGATTTPTTFSLTSATDVATNSAVAAASTLNAAPNLANIDISSTAGANAAILSIDNALNTVNSLQANLGAAQNRFSSIAATQT